MRAARDIILGLPPDIKKQLVFWAPRFDCCCFYITGGKYGKLYDHALFNRFDTHPL